MIDDTVLLALFLIATTLIAISWSAGSNGPYKPTNSEDIDIILKEVKIQEGTNFYDLGSGDGRVAIQAAKLGAICHGIEQSWVRVWIARFKAKKYKNVHFYHGNFFDREYYPADVIYTSLNQSAMEKLEPKLKKELKKDAIVITHLHHFKNWKPFKKVGEFKFYKL